MAAGERRYLSAQFVCARCYQRLYINRDETAYEGRCPRCLKAVRVAIDPVEGTDTRQFTVDCGQRL